MARVLLATEDVKLADEMKAVLHECGHKLVGVVTADFTALRAAQEKDADVLLFDDADLPLPFEIPGIPILTLCDRTGVEEAPHPDGTTNPYRLSKPVDRLELKHKLECAAYNAVREEKSRVRFEKKGGHILSEEWFKTLFEYAPDTYYISDLNGTLVDGNRAAEELTGYERGELIGKNLFQIKLLHLTDLPKAARLLQENRRGQPTGPAEFSLFRKNGAPVTVEVRTYPIEIGDRRLVLGIARDVTDRKRSEEALRASERRFRTIFELSPESITLLDRRGKIVTTNGKIFDWLGYKPKEVIGKKISSLRIFTKSSLVMVLQQFRRRLKGQDIPPYEAEFLHKDGRKVFGRIAANPIRDERGKITSVLVMISNITERKRTEEELLRLSNAVSMSTDSIVISDLNGTIVDVNEATVKMYGAENKNELIGKSSFDLIVPEERERALAFAKEALQKGYVKNLEYHVLIRDGRQIPIEMSAAIMKDAAEKPIGFVGVSRDITERKRGAEILREERDRVQNYLDIAGVIILALDAEGRVTLINQKGCEVLGYHEREILGKNWLEKFLPEWTKERVQYAFQRIMDGEVEPLRYMEHYVQTKDGKNRLIAWNNTVFTDDEGRIVGTLSSGEDITKRRKAEVALKESEERYRFLFERGTALNLIIGVDGTLLDSNISALKEFGYTRKEVQGRNALEFVAPADRELIAGLLEKSYGGEDTPEIDAGITAKDGSVRTILFSRGNAVLYEQGQPTSIVVTGIDITERKLAEEALRESEERLKATLDALPDILFEVDRHGCIYDFRSPNLDLLYIPPQQFLGKKVAEVVPEEAARIIMDALAQATESGSHRGAVYSLPLPEGTRWFELSIAAKGNPQTPEGRLIVTTRDITERKEAELERDRHRREIEAIFDNMEVLLWSVREDKEGRLYYERVNRPFASVEKRKPEDFEGGYLDDLHGEEYYAAIKDLYRKLQRCEIHRNERVVDDNGDRRFYDVSLIPIPDSDGKVRKFIGSAFDFTERKLAQEQTKRALQEKEVLLKEIHHRVKNNLQIISSLLSLESETIQDEKMFEIISNSQNRIKSMALIHEKLYQSENLSLVDFPAYVRSLLDTLFFSYTTGSRFVNPELDLCELYLDINTAIPLALVINELVSNALEHAFPEEREGRITVSLKQKKRIKYVLCIADDGVGFPDNLDYRCTKSIGLQLVNMLTKQIGAELTLKGNGGTEFKITFPVKEP
jgi:PAS domain S-box-containing protein